MDFLKSIKEKIGSVFGKGPAVHPIVLPAEEDLSLPDGLSAEEVEAAKARGDLNVSHGKAGKSYGRIIADNLFTLFNLVWAIVTLVLVLVDSLDNLTYLVVVIPNLLIAIIQESRAKATVEKLSVTTDPRATVVRDGVLVEIPATEVVRGDVMEVSLGRQVLSDGIVISGVCEANESMLTGESVAIKKAEGDRVYAGSFLVSGRVFVRVDKVGNENYIHTIEKAAKRFKAPTSNLFRDLNRLIKFISGFMIPLAIGTAFTNWLAYRGSYEGFELLKTVVEKTCGSIVGMVPAGVYLLVTLTLSLSQITLGRKNTLVQDMYSIEMLAAADVLCLDKTGTITDGTMEVCGVLPLAGYSEEQVSRIMSYIEGTEEGMNATSRALISRFGRNVGTLVDSIPFSSARKFSAVHVEEIGAYAVGAPHFVPCDVPEEVERLIQRHTECGERVLLLAKLDNLATRGRAVALITLSDRIRTGAKETVARFQEQGVQIKVISGDHAATVSNIAARVGIMNADRYISCENMSDEELILSANDFAVFGRVTPEQKVLLVKSLQAHGHTVAMTGDGVNDTLALKEANCAIAMADGSEVAAKVAQIVLLDSDFTHLPEVVREGRRCINNVRQSAVLYLMKTLFTIFISIFSVLTVSGYPFGPNNFLFLELFIIGTASVLLALEPNDKRIKGAFLETVLIRSAPCALAMFIPTLVILTVGRISSSVSVDARNAVAMCAVTLVGFVNLVYVCRPYTRWRAGVVTLVGVLLAASVALSSVVEALLVENGIFGFTHAVDQPRFFAWMMLLGLSLSVLFNFFRSSLEAWFASVGKKAAPVSNNSGEKKEGGEE